MIRIQNICLCIFIAIINFDCGLTTGESPVYDRGNIFSIDSFQNKRKHYSEDGKLISMEDTAYNGNSFGNRYEFYSSGVLKHFNFLIDSINSSYLITFDSITQKAEMQGTPLVYRIVSADEAKDSILIKYYVSTFFYKKLTLSISDSLRTFVEQIPYPNNEYNIANLLCFKFWKNVSQLNRYMIIAKIDGITLDNKTRSYSDTINKVRKIPID